MYFLPDSAIKRACGGHRPIDSKSTVCLCALHLFASRLGHMHSRFSMISLALTSVCVCVSLCNALEDANTYIRISFMSKATNSVGLSEECVPRNGQTRSDSKCKRIETALPCTFIAGQRMWATVCSLWHARCDTHTRYRWTHGEHSLYVSS